MWSLQRSGIFSLKIKPCTRSRRHAGFVAKEMAAPTTTTTNITPTEDVQSLPSIQFGRSVRIPSTPACLLRREGEDDDDEGGNEQAIL